MTVSFVVVVRNIARKRYCFPWMYYYLLYLSIQHLTLVSSSNTQTNATFLWLSDLHMDPFYGSANASGGTFCQTTIAATTTSESHPLGQIGCDSPFDLVQQSIQFAKNLTFANVNHNNNDDSDTQHDQESSSSSQSSQPTFLLLTGDLVRHGTEALDDSFERTRSILFNISQMIITSFPEMSIIPTIGNNDVTPDYYLDIENPTSMLEMILDGLDPFFQSSEERKTFRFGGYFARNVSTTTTSSPSSSTSTLTILSMNTVIYSTSHTPQPSKDNNEKMMMIEDPLGQFSWLETQLQIANASSRHVYLVGHIPPAIGSYRHSQLWHDIYLQRYYSLIEGYRSIIMAQCFGHLHADEFRFIYPMQDDDDDDDDDDHEAGGDKDNHEQREGEGNGMDSLHRPWPILLGSSVTPVYGSHPSIRRVTYDVGTHVILDYDTWFLNLEHPSNPSTWEKEHSFIESFPVAIDLSSKSLFDIVLELNATIHDDNASMWKALKRRQHVSYDEPNVKDDCTDIDCRNTWLCTITSPTVVAYHNCLESKSVGSSRVTAAPSGIAPSPNGKSRWGEVPNHLRSSSWTTKVLVMIMIFVLCCSCLCYWCGPRYLLTRRWRYYRKPISQEDDDDGNVGIGGGDEEGLAEGGIFKRRTPHKEEDTRDIGVVVEEVDDDEEVPMELPDLT